MDNYDKRQLDLINGHAEDHRTDGIKNRLRDSEYDKNKEHAVMRKSFKEAIEFFEILYYEVFGKKLPEKAFAKFKAYFEAVETMITDATNETNEVNSYEQ